MNNLGTAKLIVEEVFSELDGRSGFDHWWGGIEEDIADEILDAVADRVKTVLDRQHVTIRGCERDTDGDGDCALCAHSGGCFGQARNK